MTIRFDDSDLVIKKDHGSMSCDSKVNGIKLMELTDTYISDLIWFCDYLQVTRIKK